MSIENTLTDQLNLIQREEAKGLFRLFSRQRSVSDGFCLAVFRKEEYRGSILSDDVFTEGDLKRRSERLGVRDGDIILRVNLGSRPLSISEKLGTRDGYTRPYTLELEIAVNDPRNFAQRYIQSSDPVKLARMAIEGHLQRNSIRAEHDELRSDMLRTWAEQALKESRNRSFGLEVVAAHKITLYMDPIRSKELEIEQQSRLKEKEIREKSRITQIETEEETDMRKATVRRDAEVKRRATEYEQELEAYLQEEKAKQRETTRIEESREKDHQLSLESKQNRFLRLEAGKDLEAKRAEELKGDDHEASRALFKLQQDREHRKLTRIYELEEQDHQQFYAIEEQARKLEIEAKSSAHTRYEKLQEARNNAEESAINALSDRMNQMIEDGQPLDEVLNELSELRERFQGAGRSGRRGAQQQEPLRIEEASNRSRPAPTTNEKSNTNPVSQPPVTRQETTNQRFTQETGTLPGILRQPNDTINITDLGMTLIQTQLSATQQDIAATRTSTAFLISNLDEHGPARKAQLAIGDIVIEINEEEPRDIQSISRILQAYRPGSSVPFCILRGEELKNVEV